MAKIKAIVKRPDEKYGHMTNVSPSVSNLQATVGGYFESVSVHTKDGEVSIICNEDGKSMGLDINMFIPGDFLVGTIIICGTKGSEYSDIPITFAEWKAIVDEWSNREKEAIN